MIGEPWRGALKSQIGLEILSDLTDQPFEGQFAEQNFSGFSGFPIKIETKLAFSFYIHGAQG